VDIDWEDIQACLRGEDEAYSRIIRRHESVIATQMRRFANTSADREDLVQEVFVEAFFSLPRYQPQAPFLHWLRKIATHVGYQYWRKNARRPNTVQLQEHDSQQAGEEEQRLDPEQAELLLKKMLARLSPADRTIMTLMYFDNCALSEISERTGWNRTVIKMRAYRARKKLRKIAQEEKLLEKLSWMS
jgi:RNA polymerase sigma-70 factor (ECF subfamily)